MGGLFPADDVTLGILRVYGGISSPFPGTRSWPVRTTTGSPSVSLPLSHCGTAMV